MPSAGEVDLREQSVAESSQQFLKKSQGKAFTGAAVRARRKPQTAQSGQGRTSRVAMQNLNQEDVYRRYRIQDSVSAPMTEVGADFHHRLGGEGRGDIGLEPTQDLRDSQGHPWPPVGMGY
jgi:hypothetical protein